MRDMLIKSYTEAGYQPIPPVRMSDADYAGALQCFVPACVDIVPINSDKKWIYLARRRTKPMIGWWWIGGRMMPHDTRLEEAAIRSFQRETDVLLTADRLKLTAILDYRFKDRAQMPDNIGCHALGITFTVELTYEEIIHVSDNLDRNEYYQRDGLVPFDRAFLVFEKASAPVLELYDHIFPATKQLCC